jgi:hypothetical protein
VAATCAAFLIGVQALRVLGLAPKDRAERGLVGLVVGYVLVALAILAVGLVPRLQWSVPGYGETDVLVGGLQWWVLADVLLLAALGGLRNLHDGLGLIGDFTRRAARALRYSPLRWVYGVLAVVVLAQLLAALAPAGATDFDGLAEHLAQAKQYARAGRIYPLWYDHHSQFPSTLQMWYTLAHTLGVPRAAKLFHWGFGVLALLATMLAGRRLLGPRAGAYGALVLATTPNFAWLMGVAYVDLATMTCSVLAVYLFCRWLQEREGVAQPAGLPPSPRLRGTGKPRPPYGKSGYLWLSALMAGAGAGTKMQGLALLGVLAAGAFIAVGSGRRLRSALAYVAIALAICWPWYLKSYLWTGNPVYPFAYDVLGGKMWSADRAEQYQRHQLEFGMGELPSKEDMARMPRLQRVFCGPRSPVNLLLAPINLTLHPPEFTVPIYPFGVFMTASIGPLYLAFLPLLLLRRRPRAAGWLMMIFAPLWAWWLMSMQLTRYLLPSLVLICPLAGWVIAEAEREGGVIRVGVRAALWAWTLVLMVFMLTYVRFQTPPVLGLQSEQAYLSAFLDVYDPSAYLNRSTPEDAKIALYGEPRGYYLDRDYLWADPGHSALIRYETVRTAEDLVREYRRLGITHVLIHAVYFPNLWESEDRLALTIGKAIDAGLLEQMARVGEGGRYRILRLTTANDG